jgi:regulator of protease activity HflC (stomatin/prohibitin superfamily)
MEDSGMPGGLWVVIFLAGLVLLVISKTARVVPQQSAYVVERLGRYSRTLGAGFHILWPFLDSVQYKHSLKETAIDIPEQICITRDNVQVGVDGILYSKVLDPQRASYGISDYRFRDHAAGSDRPPERDRQNRTRPHLRRAHQYQQPGCE